MKIRVTFSFALAACLISGCSKLVHLSNPASPTTQASKSSITLNISGLFQTVTAAGPPVTLEAITNDPVGVSWELTVHGNDCSPLCGTLDVAGGSHLLAMYTPPPILTPRASPTAEITLRSLADNSKRASFPFSILPTLTSDYTLLLRGFDSSGIPMAMAAILVADVNGNINDGELDINDGGKIVHAGSLQGNFGTDTGFEGIIRGSITITNFTLSGTTVNPSFKFVLRGNEFEARAIEFDASGNLMSGTILLQSGVSQNIPSGVYAFGLDSNAPVGRRTVAAGAFNLSQGGSINGVADQSQAQAALPDEAEPLIGSAIAPDAFGRGTLSFSINGVSTQYAYYCVSPGQLNFLQVGGGLPAGTVLEGTARAHTLAFDTANGVFQTSVFQLTGVETNQGLNSPDAAIGVASISEDNSVALTFDTNDAGVVNASQKLNGKLLSYDANTGRGLFSIPGGTQVGLASTLVFYLYDNGSGFTIEVDPSVEGGPVNRAFSGTVLKRIGAPFKDKDFREQMICLSGGSSVPEIPSVEAAVSVGPTPSNLTGMAYATSKQAGQLANVSFGSTLFVTDADAGHGNAMLPGGLYGDFTSSALVPSSFYLIAPGQFVSSGVQSGLPSGVSYFSPD